jgi:hypothetical protein
MPRKTCAVAVGIARAFGEASADDITAPDVEGVDRARQRHAVDEDVASPVARNPFAPRDAVGVDDEGLDDFDLGMFVQEGAGFHGGVHFDLRLWTVLRRDERITHCAAPRFSAAR